MKWSFQLWICELRGVKKHELFPATFFCELSMINLWFYAPWVTLNEHQQRISLFPFIGTAFQIVVIFLLLVHRRWKLVSFFLFIKYLLWIKYKHTNWMTKCVVAMRRGWSFKNTCLTNFLLSTGFTFSAFCASSC